MSYDYSPKFLADNIETVKKIIQIASTGEVLVYESRDWDAIKARQLLVNNILASMERNMPDYKDIRTKVRGWTAFKDEETYQLFVGVPQHKIAGRPPGRKNKAKINWLDSFLPKSTMSGATYTHDASIEDTDELTRFVGKVVSLPPEIKRAEVRVQELSDEVARDYFAGVFEPHGWTARAEGDTLILERS